MIDDVVLLDLQDVEHFDDFVESLWLEECKAGLLFQEMVGLLPFRLESRMKPVEEVLGVDG